MMGLLMELMDYLKPRHHLIPCLYTFQDDNESQNIWDKLFSCKSFVTKNV
jgi:hypothetical protein